MVPRDQETPAKPPVSSPSSRSEQLAPVPPVAEQQQQQQVQQWQHDEQQAAAGTKPVSNLSPSLPTSVTDMSASLHSTGPNRPSKIVGQTIFSRCSRTGD
jgi:hypothetical protein